MLENWLQNPNFSLKVLLFEFSIPLVPKDGMVDIRTISSSTLSSHIL